MNTTSFDIHVRTLECKRCGAPVATDQRGGEITCRYCGVVNVLSTRQAAAGAGVVRSLADEVARLSRLKAQLVNPISAHAYDLSLPPMGWKKGEVYQPAGMERASREWRAAREKPSPLAEEQRKLCWLTVSLADGYRRLGQPLKSRAVLETALEMLADDGHRQLVRCRLAVGAIDEDDLDSAAGWLAECDPFPEVLELDSAYRDAQARLHTARGDGPALLGVVGARATDIPIAPEHDRNVTLMRIHGLELAGYAAEADAELERASGTNGRRDMLAHLAEGNLAPQVRERAAKGALEQQLHDLTTKRAGLAGNVIDALLPSLTFLPVIAAFLMVPIAVSRCVADADPLLGAYGYPLCPKVCEGCHGPVRVSTAWVPSGPGEWTSDGADYYCASDKNDVEVLTDEQLEDSQQTLGPYRMNALTAAGGSYLMLLAILLVLLPFQGARRWALHRGELAALNAKLDELAEQLGVRVPPPAPPHMHSFGVGLVVLVGAAGGGALLIVLGMWMG